jgi:hypothetical protein
MAYPASINVDGSNPGPNYAQLPDTVQMPTGNIWKDGVFNLTLSPVAVAAATTAAQTFAVTGIGLLTTDFVSVMAITPGPAGVALVGASVSASDTLSLVFANATAGSLTPTASTVYRVLVMRPQPNWTAPASGNQLDW